MSTSDLAPPSQQILGRGGLRVAPRELLRRMLRGAPADPAWSRPVLGAVTALAGLLLAWGLTRNGYANTYYAAAVQAGSRSWTALFTNAEDLGGYVSLDKGPLSLWMMGLSGRIFGFSSLTMLLPNAACGVGAVLVLHHAVKRTLGHPAAALAALMLALSPIAVAVARFNNPDALLELLVVCAAWAMVRALESGRLRDLVLCGAVVGLAFNTKMLEAYVVVPGLALAYLAAGPGRALRRVGQLVAAGASMALVSFAWFGAMMLVPGSGRPWVGDTTTNSWFDLIFAANGLGRVSSSAGAAGPAGGFGGSAGPLRMFNSVLGGQIAWLLPLAAIGLATGLWMRRRAPRRDAQRAAYLMWGGWALTSAAVFSFANGIFHPYYTSLLAPAVAVLAAGGLAGLWDARRSRWATLLLAAATVATVVLSVILLGRSAGFVPWLRWLVVGLGAGAVCALGLLRVSALGGVRNRLGPLAATATVAAVVAGPGAYALATVGHATTGSNPLGGPTAADAGPGAGFAGPGGPAAIRAFRLVGPLFAGAPNGGPPPGFARFRGGRGGPGGGAASKQLTGFLKAHRGSAKYLVAAFGAQRAAAIALATDQPVIPIGGFMGDDPAPSAGQVAALARAGELRFVLLDTQGPRRPGGRGASGSAALATWVKTHATVVDYGGGPGGARATLYRLAA